MLTTTELWAAIYAVLAVLAALTAYYALAVPGRLWLEQRRVERDTTWVRPGLRLARHVRLTIIRRLVAGEVAIAAAAFGLWWFAAAGVLVAALPTGGPR